MSGWKRENGVFVLVLARFRGLEGVRILTISVFFSSLLFKRHPEGIFWRFLRFLAPFGFPLGGNFVTFFGFFEHVKKSMIFERSGEGRRHRRRPQDSLRERLGPFAETHSRRLRQAKAWRGVLRTHDATPPHLDVFPASGKLQRFAWVFAGHVQQNASKRPSKRPQKCVQDAPLGVLGPPTWPILHPRQKKIEKILKMVSQMETVSAL